MPTKRKVVLDYYGDNLAKLESKVRLVLDKKNECFSKTQLLMKQLQKIQTEEAKHQQELDELENQAKKARIICYDPIFKTLILNLPMAIINIIQDYQTSWICHNCETYIPKNMICIPNDMEHRYECTTVPFRDGANVFFWPSRQDGEIWTTLYNIMIYKAKSLNQQLISQSCSRNPQSTLSIHWKTNFLCIKEGIISIQQYFIKH